MADRPDLIQSELSGLAFDALQQCFRASDIDALMSSEAPPLVWKQQLYMVIDPAAGGPQSDFALVTFYRQKGLFVVCIMCTIISRPDVGHLQISFELVQPYGFVHKKLRDQGIPQSL